MSLLWRQALLVFLLAGGGALACGAEDEEDWQLEIRLYLFSALAPPPDAVVVEASQEGGALETVTLNHPFASCEQNQVRIVPGQDAQGNFLPVTVTVATEKSLLASKTIALTQTTGVQPETLVVGDPASPSLAPSGSCQEHLPPVQRKSLGEACGPDNECASGFCLRKMLVKDNDLYFPEGYCSSDCREEADCPAGSKCVQESNTYVYTGKGYCLEICDPEIDSCRDGYKCTDGSNCFPL